MFSLLVTRRLLVRRCAQLGRREGRRVRLGDLGLPYGHSQSTCQLSKRPRSVRFSWVQAVWPALCLALVVHAPLVGLAGNTQRPSLKIKLLAASDIETQEYSPTTENYLRVYGRRVPNTLLLIDSETRGLADAFVWVETEDRDHTAPAKPTVHRVYLANGNFVPAAFVASEGDLLEVVGVDPVAFGVSTAFPPATGRAAEGRVFRFRLREHVNRPVVIGCGTHLWVAAYVFVQQSAECSITDRLGDACVPVRGTDESIRVYMEHGVLGRLLVLDAPEGVRVVDQGLIEVASELLDGKQQIVLTVTREQKEHGPAAAADGTCKK